MLLTELLRVLWRRWYVTVPGLLLTVGLSWGAVQAFPADYSTSAEVLLLPPPSSVPAGSNPYMQLGGLDAVTDVLAKTLTTEQTVREVEAEGGSAAYVAERDLAAAAPMLLMTFTSPSEAATTTTQRLLVDRLPVILNKIQFETGIPENARITSTVVVQQTRATVSRKNQIRSTVTAAGAGVVLTTVLAAAFDALLRRRRARIDARPQVPPRSAPPPPRRRSRTLHRIGVKN